MVGPYRCFLYLTRRMRVYLYFFAPSREAEFTFGRYKLVTSPIAKRGDNEIVELALRQTGRFAANSSLN